jgi:hypothetical protein
MPCARTSATSPRGSAASRARRQRQSLEHAVDFRCDLRFERLAEAFIDSQQTQTSDAEIGADGGNEAASSAGDGEEFGPSIDTDAQQCRTRAGEQCGNFVDRSHDPIRLQTGVIRRGFDPRRQVLRLEIRRRNRRLETRHGQSGASRRRTQRIAQPRRWPERLGQPCAVTLTPSVGSCC